VPALRFDVHHAVVVVPSEQVALLIHALTEADSDSAATAAVLRESIERAAATERPHSEPVSIDLGVAAALIDAIDLINREFESPDELRRLRIHAIALIAQKGSPPPSG
jgi:hypothetical protein